MKRFAVSILFCALFLLLSSCGADKLKKNASTATISNLSVSCGCTSTYSPVCSGGKDYDNICIAQCFGTAAVSPGHCDCNSSTVLVCGIDGQNHTECEAKNSNIEIVKYIPCGQQEI